MPTIKNGISIYRLKTMVIARLFSELTVILMVMISSIYLLVNYNATLPWPLKIILTLLILLALIRLVKAIVSIQLSSIRTSNTTKA